VWIKSVQLKVSVRLVGGHLVAFTETKLCLLKCCNLSQSVILLGSVHALGQGSLCLVAVSVLYWFFLTSTALPQVIARSVSAVVSVEYRESRGLVWRPSHCGPGKESSGMRSLWTEPWVPERCCCPWTGVMLEAEAWAAPTRGGGVFVPWDGGQWAAGCAEAPRAATSTKQG